MLFWDDKVCFTPHRSLALQTAPSADQRGAVRQTFLEHLPHSKDGSKWQDGMMVLPISFYAIGILVIGQGFIDYKGLTINHHQQLDVFCPIFQTQQQNETEKRPSTLGITSFHLEDFHLESSR